MSIPTTTSTVLDTRPAVAWRTIVVDGVRTSYLEAGEGSPVLLLHGGEFGGGAEIGWERLIPGLAQQHRVIAPRPARARVVPERP